MDFMDTTIITTRDASEATWGEESMEDLGTKLVNSNICEDKGSTENNTSLMNMFVAKGATMCKLEMMETMLTSPSQTEHLWEQAEMFWLTSRPPQSEFVPASAWATSNVPANM